MTIAAAYAAQMKCHPVWGSQVALFKAKVIATSLIHAGSCQGWTQDPPCNALTAPNLLARRSDAATVPDVQGRNRTHKDPSAGKPESRGLPDSDRDKIEEQLERALPRERRRSGVPTEMNRKRKIVGLRAIMLRSRSVRPEHMFLSGVLLQSTSTAGGPP